MSATISEDDYKPAFLSNVNSTIDPAAVSFFQDQARIIEKHSYLYPVTALRSASRQGGIQQVNFTSSSTSSNSREIVKTETLSSPKYHGDSVRSSAALIPSNCFPGSTVYGSMPPDKEIQFQTALEPAHLGTVSAQLCTPSLSSSSYLTDNSRTVCATPVLGNSAMFSTLPGYLNSFNYHCPVPGAVYSSAYYHYPYQLHGISPMPAAPVHQNYAGSLEDFYRNNAIHQFSEGLEPVEYKPVITDPPAFATTFGHHINQQTLQHNTIVLPIKKKFRSGKARANANTEAIKEEPEMIETPCTAEEKPFKDAQKPKRVKRKSKTTADEGVAYSHVEEGELPKSLPKKKKKHHSPGGIVPTDPDARRRKENMAFEKGRFIFRISDLESSDEPVNSLWFVENYQLLQKYVLKISDVPGNYEYFRTERYSGWLADEPWLYYPAKVNTFNEMDETEGVTVDTLPTKDEVEQYREEELNKKALLDSKSMPSTSASKSSDSVAKQSHASEFEGVAPPSVAHFI